ncbi:MAG: hypothetical protein ACR65O_07260 [Methylomicrobium sp.]|jgi:hypothetical protein
MAKQTDCPALGASIAHYAPADILCNINASCIAAIIFAKKQHKFISLASMKLTEQLPTEKHSALLLCVFTLLCTTTNHLQEIHALLADESFQF